MRRLYRFSIRHPLAVVILATLVLLAIAPGLLRLRLRTDGAALVPEHRPEVRLDREIRREFGMRDPLIVLLRPRLSESVFNPRTCRLVAELTAACAALPGLDSTHVRSLATEISGRFRPGTLAYGRLLEPLPETREELDALRGDIDALGYPIGTLVSRDGAAAAIHVGTPPDADRRALLDEVRRAVAGADTSGHEVDVIGAPVAETLLGTHILQDLGISRVRSGIPAGIGLLPLSIAVMALVFLIRFRSVAAAMIPLLEAAAALIFVLGLMGWTGVPIYLTMAVLPVILVSLGLADEIHVFACYSRHRAARPGEPAARSVEAAMDEMSLPVLATSVTTAIGFLSFGISPLPPVRAFGWFTAAGIVFCLLWTLTVVPALLALVRPRSFHRQAAPPEAGGARSPGVWSRLARLSTRRAGATLAAAAVLLAVTPFGIRRLTVQDSWIGGFARGSDFFRATRYFDEHFLGTHRLLLALDAGRVELRGTLAAAEVDHHELRLSADLVDDPRMLQGCALALARSGSAASPGAAPGRSYDPAAWESVIESATRKDGRIVVTTPPVHGSPLLLLAPAPGETLAFAIDSRRLALPEALETIAGFERHIRALTELTVGGVLGPPEMIETAAFLAGGRSPGTRVIPGNPDYVRWLWSAIEQVQGPGRRLEVVDPGFDRGLVTVFLKNANFADTARLMAALREYERAELAPRRIRFDFAGDVAVSQVLITAVVRSQVGSLLLSLFGIGALTSLLFRSLRLGLICMMPAGLAVAVTFAVMGWTGMPLGVATSMFASMVLGIGVDFAIHVVERHRVSARGQSPQAAIEEALAGTGPAVVTNALAVALGFGLLVLSQVPANARLGAITVVSLLSCLAATLLVIPAFLGAKARPQRARSQNGRPGH